MPDKQVEFDEEAPSSNASSYSSRRLLGNPRKPGMVMALQKIGVVENEKQGYWLLFGIIGLLLVTSAIILAVFVFHIHFSVGSHQTLSVPKYILRTRHTTPTQ